MHTSHAHAGAVPFLSALTYVITPGSSFLKTVTAYAIVLKTCE